MTYVILIIFAYLCGSIPFGKIVSKLFYGVDIQKHGSGNIGLANTVRVLGWRAGPIVLVGDVSKGFIPVIVAKHYLIGYQILVIALAAVVGHIFPLWLKFRGGKGIATGLGVTLALTPVIGGIGLLVYLFGFAMFRKSAPSSLLAIWSLPLICLALLNRYVLFYCSLAVIGTWAHRNNIKQMIKEAVSAE
jgi:glycerol-3-phosphate acyltransferase PlsY